MTEGPIETRVISDPAALKALADPLRLRVLDLVGSEPTRLWTVKDLAAALGQPVTKLYHHVKLLAASDLIVDAETRVVSGIVEHRYRCAQRSIKLDDALFGAPANRDATVASVAGIIDQARDDFVDYMQQPDPDFDHITMGRAVARLTESERDEMMQRLDAIIEDIHARRESTPDRSGFPRFAITVVMHQLNEPTSH